MRLSVIRIIPTRVGTSVREKSRKKYTHNHPHACGDKCATTGAAVSCLGSSPRVWGQVHLRLDTLTSTGIIPTRVGTRRVCKGRRYHHKDHPHACGDKYLCVGCRTSLLGSSPRVWGQDYVLGKLWRKHRIIPTRVGTSTDKKNAEGNGQDHPHACGDKRFFVTQQEKSPGSSPRVWGQVAKRAALYCQTGIIPTRVGTRRLNFFLNSLRKDHPHACGDKPEVKRMLEEIAGSSPRVWGQGMYARHTSCQFRIIPTRVGTRTV